jgi:hypothetical protein
MVGSGHETQGLGVNYEPCAIYYEEADTVEYVRADIPAVYHRVDGVLTLIFDMSERDSLIGFQLKGFRSFYLRNPVAQKLNANFMSLVGIIERIASDVGDHLLDEQRNAYRRAQRMAMEDRVSLHDLPKIAH